MVVRTSQCPALIGHHGSASALQFSTSTSSSVSRRHLCGQRTGRRPGVSVCVTGMVHGVGVVMLIGSVTPDRRRFGFSFISPVFNKRRRSVCHCPPTCSLGTWSLRMKLLCHGVWCVGGQASVPCPEPSCSTPVDGSSPYEPSSPPSVTSHPHSDAAPGKTKTKTERL